MKNLLLVILIFSFAQSAFSASCRKKIKRSKNIISQAESAVDKSVDYYDRHEKYINRAKFDMAKKYIDLAIERIDIALKKYKSATNSLESNLVTCSKRSKKIYMFMEQIQDTTEELRFKQLVNHQISIRL